MLAYVAVRQDQERSCVAVEMAYWYIVMRLEETGESNLRNRPAKRWCR